MAENRVKIFLIPQGISELISGRKFSVLYNEKHIFSYSFIVFKDIMSEGFSKGQKAPNNVEIYW